jgi:hypothetical protein
MKKRAIKIAYVRWRDAMTLEHDNDDKAEFFMQHSTGFLVQNTKKSVKLAQSYNEDGFCELIVIPKAYVEELIVVTNQPLQPKRAKKPAQSSSGGSLVGKSDESTPAELSAANAVAKAAVTVS